jgi:DNA helicase-2/ATP-dependent DNA helicase PcrA
MLGLKTQRTPKMKNTPEQEALFKWVDQGKGHGVLISVAGSGKTTSIIQALNYIDDVDPVIVCSFTKLVAEELSRRVRAERFTNVNSTTLNSLGWGLCKQNVPGVKLDQFKTTNILRHHLSKLPIDRAFQDKVSKVISGTIKRVVGLLKSYVVRADFDLWLDKVMINHDIEMPEGESEQALYAKANFNSLVEKVYRTSVDFIQEMDFDDQKFMPVYYNWAGSSVAWVIVDECQDCNICDIELVSKFIGLYKSPQGLVIPTRTLWVGDPRQSIYGFRGSLPDAVPQIVERFKCNELALTVCWRCPDKVLEVAREIVPIITGPDPNPRGEGIVEHITTEEFKKSAAIGDYVICRTTAPLVKRCLEFVRRDIPALVKGKDVGRSLLDLIEIVRGLMEKQGRMEDSHDIDYLPSFINELGLYKTQQVDALSRANREEQAIAISDRCEALEAFCLDANSLAGVRSKIDSLFADNIDEDSVVLFLTGHKSKGLQRKRIFFLRPDLSPHPRAKSANAALQEENLRYVIITRSEAELYFVMKEKDEK